MQSFDVSNFSKEQLLLLNTLVQSLDKGQRLEYLRGLGELWDFLESSPNYFMDERDYNIYTIIKIGDQSWLGENLRYKGVRHQINPDFPNISFGCLYDWATLMDIEKNFNRAFWGEEVFPHQGIAPKGWHIPSDEDWLRLERSLGMSEEDAQKMDWRGDIGTVLKSTSYWKEDGIGNNNSGFDAIPVGGYTSRFVNLWEGTMLGSSTEYSSDFAYARHLFYDTSEVCRDARYKAHNAFVCRCVK